jgi:ADP-ribosylation factor-like protein 8
MKGENFHDLDNLTIFGYPQEIVKPEKNLIENIAYGHELEHEFQAVQLDALSPNIYKIDEPVPLVVGDLNLSTICLNGETIIGLILDNDDNPFDYKEIFQELVNELVNIEKSCSFEDEIEIENLLITLFIDLRRYGDEIIEKYPSIEIQQEDSFIKIFLFGIDEVGKTSLVRRLKTGQFNDNYFTPTRRFNIDYVQQDEMGLIAWWDMPGQLVFRKKWLIGLQDSNLIVFMIDVSDQIRFEESKKEFYSIINRYELAGVPLLILGNKVDLVNNDSLEPDKEHLSRLKDEIFAYFDFHKIENRPWKFLFTSVKTNYRVDEVLDLVYFLISSNNV